MACFCTTTELRIVLHYENLKKKKVKKYAEETYDNLKSLKYHCAIYRKRFVDL